MSSDSLNCSFTQPPSVTVGEIFDLKCDVVPTIKSSSQIKFILKDEFILQIAGREDDGGSLVLHLRSDRVGEIKLQNPELEVTTDGTAQTFHLPDLNWSVRSVQDPQKPVKEPFGPLGYLKVGAPWGIFAAGAVCLLLVLLAFYIRQKRVRRDRAKLAKLEKAAAGLDPLTQLYKSLRIVELSLRNQDVVTAHPLVREAFAIFLQRSNEELLRPGEAKRFFRRNRLQRYYWLWERVQSDSSGVTELENLREMLLRECEKIVRDIRENE